MIDRVAELQEIEDTKPIWNRPAFRLHVELLREVRSLREKAADLDRIEGKLDDAIEKPRVPQSPLATREEAMEYCRVGKGTFDRDVRPHLRTRKIGGKKFYLWEDLETWLLGETRNHTSSNGTPAESSTSASESRLVRKDDDTSQRERAMLSKLKSARRRSTVTS